MNELRKDRRAPASLKVKYKSATVDDFIEQFGADVSRGGIFIKTKKPLETGSLLKFEFQLQSGASVIHGVGRVAWRRLEARARADLPAGMGIKFIKLDEQSRSVIDRIESRHGAGSRFDQTEAAELAPPLSSVPPGPGLTPPPAPRAVSGSVTSGTRPTPRVPAPLTPNRTPSPIPARMNGPKMPASRSFEPPSVPAAPTYRPPPPAVSSMPPALGDAWPSRPAASSGAPKGALGGINSTGPRKPLNSSRSAARDTSEFLASAFSVGGAGAEVRNQARAQVERARRDPQSVDLANELFGDLSEPSQKHGAQSSTLDVDSDLEGLRALSSDPKPPSPEERSLAERIPSIEELVNEATQVSQVSTGAVARRASQPVMPAHVPASAAKPSSLHAPANDSRPLSLELAPAGAMDLGVDPLSSGSRTAKPSSVGLTLVLGGVLCVLVAGGAFFMLRSHGPSNAPLVREPAVAPSPQPSAAVAPSGNPQPSAAGNVTLQVSVEPAGAEVLVDGKPAGAAPLSLSLPAQTSVEVSIRSPGFVTKTEKLTASSGMAPLNVALVPLAYELTIVTDPKGAIVHVGDASVESPSPLALGHIDGQGAISADVEKEGYQRVSRSVRLDEFQERDGMLRAELTIALSPLAPGGGRRRAVAPKGMKLPEPPAPPAVPEPGEAAPVMQVKPEANGEAPAQPAAPAHEAHAPSSAAPPPAAAAAPAEPAAPPKPAPAEPAAPAAPAAP